ncbi:hypothetical protein CKAH01_11973, partial [Colletotrichum kahawae]
MRQFGAEVHTITAPRGGPNLQTGSTPLNQKTSELPAFVFAFFATPAPLRVPESISPVMPARRARSAAPALGHRALVQTRRKADCRFSVRRLAHRRNVAGQLLPTNYSTAGQQAPAAPDAKAVLDLSTTTTGEHKSVSSPLGSPAPKSPPHRIQELYVDRALTRARRPPTANSKNAEDLVFVPNIDNRQWPLEAGRLDRQHPPDAKPESVTNSTKTSLYIRNKGLFEATVNGPNFLTLLERSKPWSCLYHTILALGSQYADGGTFEAGKGESWRLFSVALGGFSDLLLLPDSLTILQALTAIIVDPAEPDLGNCSGKAGDLGRALARDI